MHRIGVSQGGRQAGRNAATGVVSLVEGRGASASPKPPQPTRLFFRFWERKSAEVGKRRRSDGVATTNPGAQAGKSAKKIYGGVLKEVGPAIATVLTTTLARCSRSGRSPPPRVHSPGTPPLPYLSSGYIIGNLRAQQAYHSSPFFFFFFFSISFSFLFLKQVFK